MLDDQKIIVLVPAFNEAGKIASVVKRASLDFIDTLLVIDDGSTDETAAEAARHGATVLSMPKTSGVGASLRAGIEYGRKTGHDIAIFMAGNDKDDPTEIPRLVAPITQDNCDFVMGSRYLPGGQYGGDMPGYRKFATRMHPWLVSRFVGKKLTESTNGFRAFRLSLLDDERINLDQRWLDRYGLEVYLLMRTIQLGYSHTEVPCSKYYPPRKVGNTKMRPITGWYSILRPILLTGFRIRT